MKDLYRTLAIEQHADDAQVAEALQGQSQMRGVELILLDQEKRAAYDRAHDAMKAIGVLRHRLGLDSGDSWFLKNYPDYAPRLLQAENSATSSQPDAPAVAAEANHKLPRPRKPDSESRSDRLPLIILGAVIVALVILAYLIF